MRNAAIGASAAGESTFLPDLIIGLIIAFIAGLVLLGGIKRIGVVASRMVPAMVIVYFLAVLYILVNNFSRLDDVFMQILKSAFTGEAVGGGTLGAVILTGVRRAAFSNEAGIGTEALAHGAAKTSEPVREGLVAMLGPFIDTLVVCSLTAFAILLSGADLQGGLKGIALTTEAFKLALPVYKGVAWGEYLLLCYRF